MLNPLVSVIMPSYNHARFIGRAIESVLNQSFLDYEFLISDDGSQDNTNDIVRKYSDKRIVFFDNKENRGACIVHNELLKRSKGKYVALINSDDMWIEGKLEKQVEFLEKNQDISGHFGRAVYVDEHDSSLEKSTLAFGGVFDQKNRTQAEWLRFFFDCSNCLCHPTSMIKRDCYTDLGGYNNRLRQLPDYDMWIRFIKKFNIHISKDPLIRFRVLPGENASSATAQNNIRTINEHYLIAAHYFDNVQDDLFLQAFSDRLQPGVPEAKRDVQIEKTLQYFVYNQWLGGVYKAVGLRMLFDCLNDDRKRHTLHEVYGIDDRTFQKMSVEFDAFRPSPSWTAASDREVFNEFMSRAKKRMLHKIRRR